MRPALQRDPHAAAVIAAAFVIVAKMTMAVIPALMEIIVIRVIVETHARRAITGFGVPAVAIAITGDVSGGWGSDGNPSRSGVRWIFFFFVHQCPAKS